MANVQYPKNKGGIGLVSPELIHILRDPPSSISTRKKERVDFSDVTYMIREDDTRTNEAISYYGKGYNPMVEVSYSNMGGATTAGQGLPQGFIQDSKNPYKVMKDGAFRPPTFTQAQLLPLSRQKFADHAVITNPGFANYSHQSDLFEKVDKPQLMKSYQMNYTRGNIQPTAFWKISYPTELYTRNNVNELKAELYKKQINATSSWNINIPKNNQPVEKKYLKENILKMLPPNFSIIVYDSGANNYSEIQASIKDKETIAVNSAVGMPIYINNPNGQSIKLKDYKYSIVESTPGLPSVMLTIQHQPDLQLGNNIPLYTVTSNMSMKSDKMMENVNYDLQSKQQMGTVISNISSNAIGTPLQLLNTDPYTKPSKIEEYRKAGFNNQGTVPVVDTHNIPVLTKNKLTHGESYGDRFGN